MWTQIEPQMNNCGEMETERWEYHKDEHGPVLGFAFLVHGCWYADCINDGCDVASREDAMFMVEEFYRDYDPEQTANTVKVFLESDTL